MTKPVKDEIRRSAHNGLRLRKLRRRSLLTFRSSRPTFSGGYGGCAFLETSGGRSSKWTFSTSSSVRRFLAGRPFDDQRTTMHALSLSAHYFVVGVS
jgi:hypothetical protein